MSYPYGETYLEQIRNSARECNHIREAYHVLLNKYMREHETAEDIELTMAQRLGILGEAFDYESWTITDVPDSYHFMWDILDALLTPKEEEDGKL